jgi:hypothetical protein
MAISGLFIFIFSLVYPWTHISEIRLKILENETKVKIMNIESKELGEQTESLNKEIDLYDNKLTSGGVKRNNNADTDKQWDNILLKYNVLHQKRIEFIIKCEEVQGRVKQIDALLEELGIAWIFLIVGSLVGSFICITGFHRWYFLIQKPNDLLLKKQIERNELKPSKAPEASLESQSDGGNEK